MVITRFCHIGHGFLKFKKNHPISSKSHPLTTANKAIHNLKRGGLQNQQGHHIILTKYETVNPTAVSEN